ncbi:hypothetical protein [Streptomyces sp. NPDC002566]
MAGCAPSSHTALADSTQVYVFAGPPGAFATCAQTRGSLPPAPY